MVQVNCLNNHKSDLKIITKIISGFGITHRIITASHRLIISLSGSNQVSEVLQIKVWSQKTLGRPPYCYAKSSSCSVPCGGLLI